MATRILAVDDNNINLKLVSATLTHVGYEVFTALSGPEALGKVNEIRPDVIILDVMMPEMDGYEVCRRLRKNPLTAHLPIMMLTAHDTLDEKIKGFEAGADEYLTKPFQPAELQARIRVLLRRSADQHPAQKILNLTAKVIGVFSLRGGVGVSSMAANLAAALAQIWGEPTVLMDLSLTMGQSALMLNLPLRNTWADLTNIPPDDLDISVIEETLMKHPAGTSVLAAPRKPEQGETVTAAKVSQVLKLLTDRYHYIVLDLPHDFRETTLVGLDAADCIVGMMAPELASVRAMGGTLDAFDGLQYDRNKISLVLNWTFERRGLARKDIEAALKQAVDLVVPFAPDTFVSAINLGVPPVIGSPTGPIGTLLEDYAFTLSKEEHQNAKPAAPSEAWTRVNERQIQRAKTAR